MKPHPYQTQNLLLPALALSAAIHIGAIAAIGFLPGGPQFSVLNAPNSPEFTVVSQPVVSVDEDKIVTKEIVGHAAAELVDIERVPSARQADLGQDEANSLKSLGAVTQAKPLNKTNAAPEYPRVARERGWEGLVRLDVFVDTEGSADRVSVLESSGHRVLDDAALKAVKDWQFMPARSGEIKFASKIIVPVQFSLIKVE